MNNRTEAKLTDLSGMQKAIEEILKQAWERGRKYGQNEERPQGDLISREALKNDFDCVGFNDYDDYNRALRIIDNAPTVDTKLSDKQIEKIADLLETEWGYEGIREDVARILKGGEGE